MASTCEIDPGAAPESMLVTSESCENFEQMSSSLEEIKNSVNSNSATATTLDNSHAIDNEDEVTSNALVETAQEDENDLEWVSKKKHVFVLSFAGKPIYSRYGNEDKLAWLFGVIQTLVSFVQAGDDTIKSVSAGDTLIVFLVKKPLILAAVSKTEENVAQLTNQLNYVFNQIVSVLTLTRLNKIYEQRQNYDFRRLLTGVDRHIDHLLDFSERDSAFILGAIQCLPLAPSVRDSISSAIIQSCNKIKNLVFAILLAHNKLITLVRMKKYCIHPADLHLIFNLVQASESFKTAESWTPLCLPRFDGSGFLYGHVSYLAEDCQACLLLLTVERDVFFTLSDAKHLIVEKLRRGNAMESINESLSLRSETCAAVGFPELRHFLYKCKSTAQFYQPGVGPPYNRPDGGGAAELLRLYKRAQQRLHCATRPCKLLFERTAAEAVLAWNTSGFEFYAVLEPMADTAMVIATVGKLLNWIKKQEDRLFHLNAPTF